ncbi:MAG: dihydroorotase, partial [Gammaproteobacteria bacterium]|nr:dihydroorotase [Gammaproteobacteria bacterium]
PRNDGKLTLERRPTPLPETLPFGDELLVPFRAGGETEWELRVSA